MWYKPHFVFCLQDKMASELYTWLEDIDVEDYHDQFLNLGVKKVKHLSDVTEPHLQELGMKELEIKRFMKKVAPSTPQANQEPQANLGLKSQMSPKVIDVKLPTLAFGRTTIPITEYELQKMYPDIWYDTLMNWKQRQSNIFSLNMCASAQWRFPQKKRALYDWARGERDDRLTVSLVFASPEELGSESKYFRE